MRVLAGDIGGTKCLLCVAEVEPSMGPSHAPRVEILATGRLESRGYGGLSQAVKAFLATLPAGTPDPERAGFGIAGPVRNGRCVTTNLPWVVDEAQLERELGLFRARLANDFVALAHGIAAVPPEQLAVLQDRPRDPSGPCAVIGAGTGLGQVVSVLPPGTARREVLATEGGHTSFSPRDEVEWRVQQFLAARHGHVSWERLLSGDGLVSLVEALAAQGPDPLPSDLAAMIARDRTRVPPLVTAAARAGEKVAQRALQLFCSLYGAEAGNLALKSLPTGGVFVAGGIGPRLLPELSDGRFLESFRAKGRMRPLLETFPVHVVLDDQAALRGAALLAAI
jgi:glucokinase